MTYRRIRAHTLTYMRMDTSYIYIFPNLTGFTHSISVLVLAIKKRRYNPRSTANIHRTHIYIDSILSRLVIEVTVLSSSQV